MIILPQSRGVLHGGRDPYISSVVFLNHMDELTGPEVKSQIGAHLTLGGSPASLSTTQVKFGPKSLYLGAGVNDNATTSTNYAPGTSDFTWEGWFRTTSVSDYQCMLALGTNGSTANAMRVYIFPDGSFVYQYNAVVRIQTAASYVTTNTWHFWQLRRIGTATELALNAVQAGSTYTDSNNYPSKPLWAGGSNFPAANESVRGYVDDYRITNGVGRAFAVPTAAFPNF